MTPSFWQIAIVVFLAVILFGGRGKISNIMGDVANGIKSFKKGMKDEPEDASARVEKGAEEAIDVTPANKEKA